MEFESATKLVKNSSIEEVKLLLGTKIKLAESKQNTFEVKLRIPIYLKYGGLYYHVVMTHIKLQKAKNEVLLIVNSQLKLPFKVASLFSILILLFFSQISILASY